MAELTEKNKSVHRILISISMSVILWGLINAFLVKISIWHFIIIEICIGIGEIFSTFIKGELGILPPANQDQEE